VRATIYNPKRDAFWLGLIDAAIRAGALIKEIDQTLLLQQLDHHFRSVMLDWIVGELTLAELEPTVLLGFALMLSGVAMADWRGPLAARVLHAQHSLEHVKGLPEIG
jgi:hypothetical protein